MGKGLGDLKMNNPSKPLMFSSSKLRKFGEGEERSGFTYIKKKKNLIIIIIIFLIFPNNINLLLI